MMNSKYGDLFTTEMIIQLNTVLDKMQRELTLRLYPDEREVSAELERYLCALQELSGQLHVVREEVKSEWDRPYVRIFLPDGTDAGLTFHGVPGGHEFTPFILGLYNVAGPGQPISEREKQDVLAIDKPVRMKVLVSLNCTFCPELVQAAGRIASLNPLVSVDVYDVNRFEELRTQYNLQSVPCFTINDGEAHFGKKSLGALAEMCRAAVRD